MGSTRTMKIGFIAMAMLLVCTLLGSVLIYVPFGDLFDFGGGNNQADNVPDPNKDVIAEQKKVVEQNPDDVDAVLLLANILGNSGHLNEAIPYYEKAAGLAPDDASIRLDFARALADGDLRQDAELQFQKALEIDPGNQAALYYLAELYMAWEPKRQAEAERLYQKSIDADPGTFLATQARDRLASIAPSPVASPQASPVATPATPAGDGTGG
jgi:cytochrome c-type biogenesis protein CcmH/NrfG